MPLLLQSGIALFTGLVAATFVPAVRRAVPRPVEVLLWIALLTVCVLGVVGITDPNARELSTSVAWGADQIINTVAALLLGGVGAWISDHRFAIASWMVLVAGADIFALVLLNSQRVARPWQPRVRLGEWMELPVGGMAGQARRQLAPADPLALINRRLAAASAVAATSALDMMVDLSIWIRHLLGPRRLAHAAATGRIESKARIDSLREATAHLGFAARAWYAAAGEPAVKSLAPVAKRAGQVIDIQALLSAQSLGWYGPLGDRLTQAPGRKDDAAEERSDRLAS